MNGTTARSGLRRAVVAVDGSPSADAAVMRAAAESALRGSILCLGHAADTDTPVPFLSEAEIARSRQAGRELLDRTAEAITEGHPEPAVVKELTDDAAPGSRCRAAALTGTIERRLLSETTAGRAEKYPDVRLTHEVPVGSPVETLAEAAERVLAVVVGRRGRGGYTGMRVGSVVHGLLHRAHCPVITIPAG
ncbi:universal stress protein [Streptomyces sp. NPDC085529]|uniref:universal stress protein n=1 Tax=Streptomyces sp. NPDC085529 TaxID=3365729 RepID=UPI0037D4711A